MTYVEGRLVSSSPATIGIQAEESAKPVFVFELRDLKMDVDDSVFTIPAGYKKLAWSDYLAAIKPKKNE